jgi:hypothetical protein
MHYTAPRNSEYVEFAEAGYGTIDTLVGMGNAPRSLRVMLDVTVLASSAPGSSSILLAGDKSAFFGLFYDAPAAGSGPSVNAEAQVVRNVATLGAQCGFVYATRVLLFLRDDGDTVAAYQDGRSGGAEQTWSAAQASYSLAPSAGPLYLGYDPAGPVYTSMRLHEFALRINGEDVCHLRPKVLHQGLTKIPDLSPAGNDLALHGVLGTDFRFASAWVEGMAYAGAETLS